MTAPAAPEQPDLVIAGRIRLADGGWGRGEVWVAGERICAVREVTAPGEASASTGARRIDVGDDFVLPGAVDAHVHCLSHSGEGVAAATRAAAAGGVTTIVEMPFDGSGPIDHLDRLLRKQDLVHSEALVDVALLGTLTPGGGWRHADSLAEGGVVGFKVSLFLTDPERFPRTSDYELLDVMSAVRSVGSTLCTHAENNEVVEGLLALERVGEPGDAQAHTRSRPPVSETLGVLTALEIAADKGAALHLCHLSLPRSIDLVNWYQSQGTDVTLETCPHYLTFTAADLDTQRGRLKINPPLRDAADRVGVWERLENGSVNVVSSDHAPWPVALKNHDRILENRSGAPGVETLTAVALGQALTRDPQLSTFGAVVDALTIAPARRFGLDARKGSLAAGKDADIMVFSPDADHPVEEDALHSNAGWSPYHGMTLGGRVRLTLSRGRQVWNADSGLEGSGGRGLILTRTEAG